MSILPVLVDGDPRLRQHSALVDEHTPLGDVLQLVIDLHDTLEATTNGIGMAAPQVGVHLRVIALRGKVTMINPAVVERLGEFVYPPGDFKEGCLSVPGVWAPVKRFEVVTVTWRDVAGKGHRQKMRGLSAIVLQHEIDHLDGILFIDRIKEQQESVSDVPTQ